MPRLLLGSSTPPLPASPPLVSGSTQQLYRAQTGGALCTLTEARKGNKGQRNKVVWFGGPSTPTTTGHPGCNNGLTSWKRTQVQSSHVHGGGGQGVMRRGPGTTPCHGQRPYPLGFFPPS
ncbi:hypothetical protein JZ751_005574 [Albula glossodonta]|uniref:Uncharacterized protein n=1 Tax=Albula glossodonta TaxID=121402 RepID=A0A8T2N470_9TELE|nr:hypothetical protein JZ751_005574 [Albula glossodonta]